MANLYQANLQEELPSGKTTRAYMNPTVIWKNKLKKTAKKNIDEENFVEGIFVAQW